MDVLTLSNPTFRAYLFYGSILVVKTMAMSLLTARQRFKNKAFANPEDTKSDKLKPRVHEDVERVRRAHLNDLENIPLFLVASFAYLFTSPAEGTAILLFRIYTIARFTHTLVYAIVVVPQPARALCFLAGTLVTSYMAIQNILHFCTAHLNDLENITMFLFASLGYILTNPSATVAIILFRVFTAARLLHTVVYAIFVVPQPARALSWGVGYTITGYMAVQTLLNIRP